MEATQFPILLWRCLAGLFKTYGHLAAMLGYFALWVLVFVAHYILALLLVPLSVVSLSAELNSGNGRLWNEILAVLVSPRQCLDCLPRWTEQARTITGKPPLP